MESNQRNRNAESRIPDNDPSKAMDSKREVEQSNDSKTDQDFPGYPHYPAKEDIMDQRTDIHRVDVDVENLPSGPNGTGVSQRFMNAQDRDRSLEGMQPQHGLGDDESDDKITLDVLDSKNEEIGAPQNVSNEELGNISSGTDVLDEMENIDNDDKR
jgi:hypothetical protein